MLISCTSSRSSSCSDTQSGSLQTNAASQANSQSSSSSQQYTNNASHKQQEEAKAPIVNIEETILSTGNENPHKISFTKKDEEDLIHSNQNNTTARWQSKLKTSSPALSSEIDYSACMNNDYSAPPPPVLSEKNQQQVGVLNSYLFPHLSR